MGCCIACFLRDIAGALGLHGAAKVQYVRPEIIGLVLGSFCMSVATHEFKPRAGSSPALRFVIGGFVMVGALAFLGCPLRMMLRLAGGDFNALVALRLPDRRAVGRGVPEKGFPEAVLFPRCARHRAARGVLVC
jgi:YedE family putative selenium metabolism protein